METKIFDLEMSKREVPCLWEQGGGGSNTGDAMIVAGKLGFPRAPIYIKRSGHLSNGHHALIPVEAGCIVVEASHHREDFTFKVWELVGVPKNAKKCPFRNGALPEGFDGGRCPECGDWLYPTRRDHQSDQYPAPDRWYIVGELKNEFSQGEWENQKYMAHGPVSRAKEKALCYHCREPHYVEVGGQSELA